MAEGDNNELKPANPEQMKPKDWKVDIYSPEITERAKRLIMQVDVPDIIKEHMIENIDVYDRAELIRMLWRYFERNRVIREREDRDKRELEEAHKRYLDALDLERKDNHDEIW